MVSELCDLSALTLGAIAVDRALPSRLRQSSDRLAHPRVDLVADREADPGVAAVLGEGVGSPADVGAAEVGFGQLLQGKLQDLEVGGGVAGAQDPGQRLARLGQVAEQGVETEATLVVAGGALLLGVGEE